MDDAVELVVTVLLLTIGSLGDRFGRARALQAGLIIFGASSLTAPLATSIGHLIAVRVAMGVGGALIMPSTLSVIANVFPKAERGKAITVWAGVSGVGIGLGPLGVGLRIQDFARSAI